MSRIFGGEFGNDNLEINAAHIYIYKQYVYIYS